MSDSTFEEESRLELQSRLSLVFAVLTGVSSFYALTNLLARVVSSDAATTPLHVPLATLGVAVINAVLAWRCRRGRRSVSELRTLDALATAVMSWVSAATLSQVPPPSEAAISLQLSMAYILMARAVLLPSSALRTLAICCLSLAPCIVVGTWLRTRGGSHPPEPAAFLREGYVVLRGFAITAFLATLTSNVIYGLRRRVQENARVGQYLLREKLGAGGMGVVYRATHALLRRDTAVKLLLPARVGAEDLARFEREVKLTAQLTHPNTVAIFDYGRTPDGTFYYAMEHLEGGDLERLIEFSGPLPPGRAIWILEQLCRALSEAHAHGLVHRDIKPSNVILCERGGEGDVAKLVDFGLVEDLRAEAASRDVVAGTPLYMSPEAISAPATLDARCDLYSLGALGYFLLTGTAPFDGANLLQIYAAHLHDAPRAPSQVRDGLSRALDATILRCLEKQPAARFADAGALRAALLACDEATRWDASQAVDWWAEQRADFRAHCERRRQATLATRVSLAAEDASALRVDLARRNSPQ
ncbi:MAG TPA: serine/threonine-protein kinase [Polyangiales bacterium]|nr:serine/threonine-protein kinase [Polyangiales bacterium]